MAGCFLGMERVTLEDSGSITDKPRKINANTEFFLFVFVCFEKKMLIYAEYKVVIIIILSNVLQLFLSVVSFRDTLTASKKKCFICNPKDRRWKETCAETVSVVRWYVIPDSGLLIAYSSILKLVAFSYQILLYY